MRAVFKCAAVLVSACAVAAAACVVGLLEPKAPSKPDRQHAVARGLLLSESVKDSALTRGVDMAEALRVHYGVDTGNLLADRLSAATRAQTYLDGLVFDVSTLHTAARRLGYDLDRCADYCGNVRRLVAIELRKEKLSELVSQR